MGREDVSIFEDGSGHGDPFIHPYHAIDPPDEEDDADHIEEDSYCDQGCVTECRNHWVPHYKTCVCAYDVLRSIPTVSIASIAIAIVGYSIAHTNLVSVVSVIAACGVKLTTYETYLYSYGVFLFVADGVLVVTSCLLSGWTREALCKSLTTGIFEDKRGGEFHIGTAKRVLTHFGLFLMKLFMV